MAVPYIDLRRLEPGFAERWADKCREISAAARFVGGPESERLERSLEETCGVEAAVGCANGTDALQLALRAAGVGAGDLVLIPDATFWATFEAVVNCGARPVTVDVDVSDLEMDFELFRRAVERHRPKAAILVHLYGWGSARLDDFRAFCRERQLPLVEDGAQAFGTLWRGEPIFSGSELATLSFYPAKVLGACGDAGAVLCADAELAAEVRRLGNHGRATHYEHSAVGWNSRISELDAAYLNLSLEHTPERLASRRRAAARYRQALAGSGLEMVAPPAGYTENAYLSVALADPDRRQELLSYLARHDVGCGTVYPGSMSRQPGARGYLAGAVGGKNADLLSRSVLNLPLFAHIADQEVEEVLGVVRRALAEVGRGVAV